ncbi:MAG: DUF72 domain-containing protein [Chloroflexi bacterium]|nr:DUF72 domain-containing protein [Chloroflexota bacterium]
MAGLIKVGTCSWTDATLLASGFYPSHVRTPEERLQFYATLFPVVEVDSTYYGLPSEKVAGLWAERTPSGFTFDVKAFAAFTGHPTPVRSLPKAVREALPAPLRTKARLYLRDLAPESQEVLWEMFTRALLPLDSAGKLGVVLFQFPPWFVPRQSSWKQVVTCRERMGQYRVAVEFRNALWFSEGERERTLSFLGEHRLPYVAVDEPHGLRSSVPAVAEATAEIAIVRFHGRNREDWERKGATVQEKFRYLYTPEELGEWVPRIRRLAEQAREVHVLFSNCYGSYAPTNAQQIQAMLGEA